MTQEATRRLKPLLMAHREIVIYAYKHTKEETPAETVDFIVNLVGLDNAKICIAECINSVGDWDKRLYDEVREWAKNVPLALSRTCLESHQIYDMSSWIHTTHLNQIGQEIMKREEKL